MTQNHQFLTRMISHAMDPIIPNGVRLPPEFNFRMNNIMSLLLSGIGQPGVPQPMVEPFNEQLFNEIPLKKFNMTNEHDNRTCVICLEDFVDKMDLKFLSCNHFYHTNCIKEHLKRRKFCPLCKRPVNV